MSYQYEDIINLPHHVSKKHPQMPIKDRAAQFAPFAALTGHNAAVDEKARTTNCKIELDETEKEILNERLLICANNEDTSIEITICYFVKDTKKAGGSYINITGTIKKIDEYEHNIVMTNGIIVPIDDVISIDSVMFNNL